MSRARYEARGRLVMCGGEPVGMFLSEELAVLAAAGMNTLGQLGARPRPHEELQPRHDFRPSTDWPTQYLPQIPT
jgi:hypothetical protein